MQYLLLQQASLDSLLDLLRAPEAITHGLQTHIQSQADHELTVRGVAAPMHNVLWLDLKRSWVINLFEIASEISLMVVLPFDESADLICEL